MIDRMNAFLVTLGAAALANAEAAHHLTWRAVAALLDAVKAFLAGCMALVTWDTIRPDGSLADYLQAAAFATAFAVLCSRLVTGWPPRSVPSKNGATVLHTTALFAFACILLAALDHRYAALAAFAVFAHAERVVVCAASPTAGE